MRPCGTWLCLLLGLTTGCTITATDASVEEGPSNACSSDADCVSGNCAEGICQTLSGQLESLLIEVTPTSDSALPHLPFVQLWEDVPTSGGQLSIELTPSVRVRGHLFVKDFEECTRTFKGKEDNDLAPAAVLPGTDEAPDPRMSIPVTVTLTPRAGLLGLPTQVYLADATEPTLNKGAVDYTFDLQVPGGVYDVYVVPSRHILADADERCRVPPHLFRGEVVPPPLPVGDERIQREIALEYTVSAANSLPLQVSFPESAGGLEGWIADIIEPLRGNAISSEYVLTAPSLAGSSLEYTVPLVYSAVVERGESESGIEGATDLVRLRPPAGLVAPTVFLDRAGLGLFDVNELEPAVVQDFKKYPSAVTVEGQMAARDDGKPARGYVSLVSTKIFGVDAGVIASFQTLAMVGETGLFSIRMPPGTYRVYAVPMLDQPRQLGLSAYEATWEVAADVPFQAGRLLELPRQIEVLGQTSVLAAEVQAVASPQSISPFEEAFGAAVTEREQPDQYPTFVPRATAGLVDSGGRFVVEADPGSFDISVRPPETSGFAWFVQPGFQVEAGSPQQQLGRVSFLEPSVVSGVASVGETDVTSALVRAYAFLDQNGVYTRDLKEARSVVQVAETRTDESGAFRLLVPAKLEAAQ